MASGRRRPRGGDRAERVSARDGPGRHLPGAVAGTLGLGSDVGCPQGARGWRVCVLTAAACPQLFQKCCLVQRILEAWEANDHTQ